MTQFYVAAPGTDKPLKIDAEQFLVKEGHLLFYGAGSSLVAAIAPEKWGFVIAKGSSDITQD